MNSSYMWIGADSGSANELCVNSVSVATWCSEPLTKLSCYICYFLYWYGEGQEKNWKGV